MFTVVALEAGLNFMVPLYIQIVQGRTPLDTAIAMMPFNLTVFFRGDVDCAALRYADTQVRSHALLSLC